MPVITLTTDFGQADWFVGTMKGVILSLAPRARLVDLTHDIPPGDVRTASFALAAGASFFPKGTIHLVVVDPGVGGSRPALAVRTARAWFVAPDNGVLSAALAHDPALEVRALDPARMKLPPLSATFHGRDLFAPAAARLARGDSPAGLGKKVSSWQTLPTREPRRRGRSIVGEILYCDRFGNAITNLPHSLLPAAPSAARLKVPGRASLIPGGTHYEAVPPGAPVVVPGSTGYLEVAVNQGNAATKLKLKVGTQVRLLWEA